MGNYKASMFLIVLIAGSYCLGRYHNQIAVPLMNAEGYIIQKSREKIRAYSRNLYERLSDSQNDQLEKKLETQPVDDNIDNKLNSDVEPNTKD